MIQQHIKEIALDLLGEPNKKLSTDKELRFGTYGSMSVDLEKAINQVRDPISTKKNCRSVISYYEDLP